MVVPKPIPFPTDRYSMLRYVRAFLDLLTLRVDGGLGGQVRGAGGAGHLTILAWRRGGESTVPRSSSGAPESTTARAKPKCEAHRRGKFRRDCAIISPMDPYSFWVAIASTILAALSLLREHYRSKVEHEASERHRAEDRGEKSRDRRLDVFLTFLQHVEGVRNSLMRSWYVAAQVTKENEHYAIPEQDDALQEFEDEMRALTRAADTIAILESHRTRDAAFELYAKLVEGMHRTGRIEWKSDAEITEWGILVQQLSGKLCTVLNEEFRTCDFTSKAKGRKSKRPGG